MLRAVIVFCDLEPLPIAVRTPARVLLRWLVERTMRPGFRHCMVVLQHPSGGLTVLDPTMTGLRIHQLASDSYLDDLALGQVLERVRLVVVPVPAEDWQIRFGWRTCVGFVRNLLGLPTRRLVLTPWALYREISGIERQEAGL
ncbi:hypothetical protein [Ferrovibrio terrae]|uniref:hypothetical protein n=1 Tax=Ferrovibrio terrae TaxID=2594003 RepID=UPI003138223F